ncbi:hypothetical protein LCGC14_3118180 [marine sediment metagenome]|uniref:Uncharacterized protein n=1 Tax=marine sediment metagenome TaxID=412755 RepID=A0A0F8W3F3_9ZZZZ
MEPIICQNDAEIVLNRVKEYLATGKQIKDVCLLDQNNDQIVFLLGDAEISEDKARIWWDGYSSGLKAALS